MATPPSRSVSSFTRGLCRYWRREREGIDLSKVKLTHHSLKDQGKRQLILGQGDSPKLQPLTEAGAGSVQEKERARLDEIIAKVNDLFEGDLTDDDRLIHVNNVIKGKVLESQELVTQASNNTKAQFANSPTLSKEIMNAVMDALEAHTTMSKQAIDSEGAGGAEGGSVRAGAALRSAESQERSGNNAPLAVGAVGVARRRCLAWRICINAIKRFSPCVRAARRCRRLVIVIT